MSVISGATPPAPAFGPAAIAYGVWIEGQRRGHPLLPQNPSRNAVMCTVGLGIAGLSGRPRSLARAYGTGRASRTRTSWATAPRSSFDTGEPLDDLPQGVVASRLDKAADGERAYPYRYEGFRLLLASGERLFLVTPGWRPGRDQTIVLPYKDVRVRLVAQS
ncbi:hypothetical protein OQI_00775 [Streptomyces pharetrae CZA14]|uniref:Type I-E CRISPR-associated protein Cas5/CasD n=1 Tax=Streptomyces pharetrae CZA14 TaxID=1144883 RepID=A0ABX3YS18_9ACTN|nr:hypothetical protein OQI_00775 [Streptomyces pharetrae CZA14]